MISSSRTVDGVKEEKKRERGRKEKERKRKEEGDKERNTVGESGSKACTALNAQPLPNLLIQDPRFFCRGSQSACARLRVAREYTSTACAPAFCILLRT